MLRNIWEKVSGKIFAPRPLENCVMNYVWINKEPVEPSGEGALCGVPLNHLDKAFRNAEKYPEATFNLWVDFSLLDDMSRFFITSHAYFSAPENLKICDLNDIPAYRELELFRGKSLSDIFARVDLARLFAMEHCFDTTETENVFYSDFDVDDVKLNSPQTSRTLAKYGMFFGTVGCGRLENGYMVFRQGEGGGFLKNKLLPKTIEDAKKGWDGWSALSLQLFHWSGDKKIKNHDTKLSAPRLREMGYKIPQNLLYTECGIN